MYYYFFCVARGESEEREREERKRYTYINTYRWIDTYRYTCRLEKNGERYIQGKTPVKKDRYNIGVCTTPRRGRREREIKVQIHTQG